MGSAPDLRYIGIDPPPLTQHGPGRVDPLVNQEPKIFDQRTTIKVPKPANFVHTSNFTRFCERFKQYVMLGNIKGENIHYLFLSMLDLDDVTYAKLEGVKLRDHEARDPNQFCSIYERIIYPPGESKALRSELAMIKQGANESMESFSFRISEMAAKAYSKVEMRNEASYTAFIQGIYNIAIKTKVHESDVDNFQDAVKLSQRLERVSKSLHGPTEESAAIFAIKSPSIGDTATPEPKNDPINPSGPSYRNNGPRGQPHHQSQGQNRPTATPARSGVRNRIRCHYCGRDNHVMRFCYRLRDDLNNGGSTLQELVDRANNRRQNHLNAERAATNTAAPNQRQ